MKAVITIIVLLALCAVAALSVKWAQDRSKIKKLTLQQSFSGDSNPDDNLFKTGAGTVSGLETNKEYKERKQQEKQSKEQK